MMLSWCCVTKNVEMCLLFWLFVEAILLLWILSPIDVTLHCNALGIFDYISRACWSKSMCSHRTIDVLRRWIIELTMWTPGSPTSSEEKSHTSREYVFISRQVRGNRLLIFWGLYQRMLKQDVLTQRPSSPASKNICVHWFAIVRLLVNSYSAAKTLSMT